MKDIRVNDQVRIQLNARVRTPNPKRGPMYVVKRSKKVKIVEVTADEVTWVGSGGYKCTTKIDSVTLVNRPVVL